MSIETANIEALERLVTLTLTIPRNQFDLETWKCGTVACAAGHACQDPWFNEQGLVLEWDHWYGKQIPLFENLQGYYALERFFRLYQDEVSMLFSPVSYLPEDRHPSGVATRIHLFIEKLKSKDPEERLGFFNYDNAKCTWFKKTRLVA